MHQCTHAHHHVVSINPVHAVLLLLLLLLPPLLRTGLSPGQCESDKNCATGDVCDQSSTQAACTCMGGVDSCKQLGTCIRFCDSTQAKKKLAAANAQVVACDPFLPNTCSGGLVCQASAAGVQLVCQDGVGIVPVEVGGVCVPADRKVLAAQFSADGKQLAVSLNAAARSAAFACSNLFKSSSLGARAWCTAADRTLTVRLDSSATLQPDDVLELLPAQSVLVDKLQSDVPFSGSVAVQACMECSPPTATVTGPQVIKLMRHFAALQHAVQPCYLGRWQGQP